jgi:hypothetical protein
MNAPAIAAVIAAVLLTSAPVCIAKDHAPDFLGIWVMTNTEAPITGTDIVVGANGRPQLALTSNSSTIEVAFVYQMNSKGDFLVTVSQILVNQQTMQNVSYHWRGKFDGTDYPVIGDPDADTWSYTQVNDNEIRQVVKKAGKVVRQATLSFHGKKCTLSGTGITGYYKRQHVKDEIDIVP